MPKHPNDRLQGTLDLLILTTLARGGPQHGYAIAQRIHHVTDEALRIEEDLRQEMETHLALIEDEGRVRGLNALQARQNARTRFGGPLVYREQAFDAVTLTWLVDAWKDVTLAARRLMRSPTFSVAALL